MGVREISAVIDAGPFIHLTEIGCIHILSIFKQLYIPKAVWAETVECGRISNDDLEKLSNILKHPKIPQSDIAWFVEKHKLHDLHSGECECLYLAQKIDVSILLTDDLAVREAAKRLKRTPVGSLGIVAKAYHLGEISFSDAQQTIFNLYEMSSLFVTKTIVEMAIEQLQNPRIS